MGEGWTSEGWTSDEMTRVERALRTATENETAAVVLIRVMSSVI